MRARRAGVLAAAGSVAALVASVVGLGGVPTSVAAAPATDTALYLVTLDGPGTSGQHSNAPRPAKRCRFSR